MSDLGLTSCESDFHLMSTKTRYVSTLLHLQHFIGGKGVFEDMRSVTISHWQLLLFKDENYAVIDKTQATGASPQCVCPPLGLWVDLGLRSFCTNV